MRRLTSLRLVFVPLMAVTLIAGCGVQEDRTMEASPDGRSLSFQHGRQGVFIRLPSGELKKIYQPADNEVAVSTPLWSPDGKSVIFCVGEYDDEANASEIPEWDDNPDGRFFEGEPAGFAVRRFRIGEDKESAVLVESHCSHAGLIAANLAVRWHPDGESVLFIDDRANGKSGRLHSLRKCEVETGKVSPAFPHRFRVLMPATSPDHKHLLVLAGSLGKTSKQPESGIWVQSLNQDGEPSWWRVPDRSFVADANMDALIGEMRRHAPAWSAKPNQFVFSDWTQQNDARFTTIREVDIATREVKEWGRFSKQVANVQLNPAGDEVGGIRLREDGALVLLNTANREKAVDEFQVDGIALRPRLFAGWNADGDRLCFAGEQTRTQLAPDFLKAFEQAEGSTVRNWALLMLPTSTRSHVVVGDRDGSNLTSIFSGMRVGFPKWIRPTEEAVGENQSTNNKLAFWATFEPSHRDFFSESIGSFQSGFSVQRRDPAVILDVETGELEWMPISSTETEQVGHYYQIHGQHEEAWKWYEKATAQRDEERDGAEEPLPSSEADRQRQLIARRDSALFRHICLRKLGRDVSAEEHNKEYTRLTSELFSIQPENTFQADQFSRCLLRDIHLASAFFSVNASDLAESYLLDAIESRRKERDEVGLSTGMLVHLQVVLTARRFDDFVRLCLEDYANEIPQFPQRAGRPQTETSLLRQFGVFATYLPLMSPQFRELVEDPRLKDAIVAWKEEFAPNEMTLTARFEAMFGVDRGDQ